MKSFNRLPVSVLVEIAMKLQDILASGATLTTDQVAADFTLTRQIQVRLYALGADVGEADGIWGQKTQEAFSNNFGNVLTPAIAKQLIEVKSLPIKPATEDTFRLALQLVLKYEGGYSDDPTDSGGATMHGITHDEYDHYRDQKGLPRQLVSNISDFEVAEIYKNSYWLGAHCNEMPRRVALATFDWAVNAGVSQALKTLQAALDISVDGEWGSETKGAIAAIDTLEKEAHIVYEALELRRKTYLAWGVGSQSCFLDGWLSRVAQEEEVLGVA
jgi:peptidoglycan hydrolase-like protein with peptidoglycan-binding domain